MAFEHHLLSPQGQNRVPPGAPTVTVGGLECCDQIRLGIQLDREHVADAGFEARGCGAATAAASAAVTLVRGAHVFEAARVGADQIEAELGGLSAAKRHAAELASDALGRALGAAVRQRGEVSNPEAGERTLVAMSGGVDSAVAALRSADEGETIAVDAGTAGAIQKRRRAQLLLCVGGRAGACLAHSMGLAALHARPARGVPGRRRGALHRGVAAGETPNPCVGCNGHVRLDAMLELADRLGCRWLATGHYARVTSDGLLRLAVDPAKDQTYMLAALSPRSLSRMRFPLGDLVKPEVRALAAEAGLPVASKADSQDLCFLAGTDRRRFLAHHGGLTDRPGTLIGVDGDVLGRHDGHHNFTVGQRRGLGVSGPEPLYVLGKDAASNTVRIGPRAALATDRVRLRGVRLRRPGAVVDRVKLRYRSRMLPARLSGHLDTGHHRSAELALMNATDGVAPGSSRA